MADENNPSGGAGLDTDGDDQNTGSDSQAAIQKAIDSVAARYKAKQTSLEKELRELKKFKDSIDTEKAKQEQAKLEEKEQFQEALENQKKQFSEKESHLNNKVSSLESTLKELIVNYKIAEIAPSLNVIPKAMKQFIQVTSPYFSYRQNEENGGYDVFPGTADNPLFNTETGKQMTVKEFLENYVKENDWFVTSITQGGSGGKSQFSAGSAKVSTPAEAIREGMKNLRKGKSYGFRKA